MKRKTPAKVLIIRFSSMGDVVLTTPVVRSLKAAFPEVEIHYLTKTAFAPLLRHNPYLAQLHLLQKDNLPQLVALLRKEGFDHVLDLHGSLRSRWVALQLGVPVSSLDKRNFDKWKMTKLHAELEVPHVVTRYGDTLKPLGVELDSEGLEVFLSREIEEAGDELLSQNGFVEKDILAVALGATHATKRWPVAYFAETLNALNKPCVLLGGKDALEEAAYLREHLKVPFLDGVGQWDLLTAAAALKACGALLTHDTGFMHIGAAFGMKVFSLWGNTVPGFGMTPYKTPHWILEVEGLACRPCSRIGFDTCPKGHFRCMRDLLPAQVTEVLRANF